MSFYITYLKVKEWTRDSDLSATGPSGAIPVKEAYPLGKTKDV